MDDLIAFVTARLDEDEAAAKATANAVARSIWESDGLHVLAPGKPGRPELPLTSALDSEMAAHIARHDPARVLREVAAKRAIVRGITAALPLLPHGDPAYQDALLHILRTVATVWGDHPDYRAEWKP